VLIELRQYRCHPGERDNWVKFMEEVIIPFQVQKGMVIVGSFVSEEEDDHYIWIRRFDDEAHRKALYAAVYESDTWTQEISPRIPTMFDREKIHVTRMLPTAASMIR
jgi:hypothetical protein